MFVDEARISVKAGNGGNGCVHFRKEKFVPKGGPDGGDGGKGGNLFFEAISNAHTLYDYRYKKDFKAENGSQGDQCNRTGRSGEALILRVPVGTIISDENTGKILADLSVPGKKVLVAEGGIGGKGNAGFVNSIRQAPKFAELGDKGAELVLKLELKLVADVALVGYPSVGKSTFISVVSNAKPKIAEYHFTTLVPNLGVAKVEDREVVFVDVPGLIEGASDGKGLGHTFLKHIERSKYVLHLIDVSSDTPLEDFRVIKNELEKFSPVLAEKPFLPVFTKIDLSDDEFEDFLSKEFENEFGIKPYKVSAPTQEGLDGLLKYIASQIPEERTTDDILPFEENLDGILEGDEFEGEDFENVVEYRPGEANRDPRYVEMIKRENWWDLHNERLEQMSRQTEWESTEAKERIYDVLRKWGTTTKLEKVGAIPGELLRIGEGFLEYRG